MDRKPVEFPIIDLIASTNSTEKFTKVEIPVFSVPFFLSLSEYEFSFPTCNGKTKHYRFTMSDNHCLVFG